MKAYLNKVFNMDVVNLLKELPENSVDMIFSDPDYNVGIKYNGNSYTKAFHKYIDWYTHLAKLSLRVLKNEGNMFFMNYPRQNAYLRAKFLDEHCFSVNEYIWIYNTNIGQSPRRFTTAHRSILHCTKTKDNKFYKDQVAVPYQNPTDKRILNNIAHGSKGRMPYSWFYFDLVKNVSKEKTFHSCQIPQKLTEMLIKCCTKEGDTVFILFGGSGSEVVLCKMLKRNYISAEIDQKYHQMIIDRIKRGYIRDEFRLNLKRNNYHDQKLFLKERNLFQNGGVINVQ